MHLGLGPREQGKRCALHGCGTPFFGRCTAQQQRGGYKNVRVQVRCLPKFSPSSVVRPCFFTTIKNGSESRLTASRAVRVCVDVLPTTVNGIFRDYHTGQICTTAVCSPVSNIDTGRGVSISVRDFFSKTPAIPRFLKGQASTQ